MLCEHTVNSVEFYSKSNNVAKLFYHTSSVQNSMVAFIINSMNNTIQLMPLMDQNNCRLTSCGDILKPVIHHPFYPTYVYYVYRLISVFRPFMEFSRHFPGVSCSIAFQYYRPQPLWIPLSWNAIFLAINAGMVCLLLKEDHDAKRQDADAATLYDAVR